MLPFDKYARMRHIVKATLFHIVLAVIESKSLVITFIDLEDKIIFRGVGNDMNYVVLISSLMTNMIIGCGAATKVVKKVFGLSIYSKCKLDRYIECQEKFVKLAL
jgi:hypothetical protein